MASDFTSQTFVKLTEWTRVEAPTPRGQGYEVVERWIKERAQWCRAPEHAGQFDFGFKIGAPNDTFAFYFSDSETAFAFRMRWC